MLALIKPVVQDLIKDLLPPAEAGTQSFSVRPAKCRSESEVRSEGISDISNADSSVTNKYLISL